MPRRRRPRIGWILAGDRRFGSSRIHGLNLHDFLVGKGIDSRIVCSPEIASCALQLKLSDRLKLLANFYDLIVFQKVYDENAVAFAGLLRKVGVKTVLLLCDLAQTRMIGAVDQVVVTSQVLADWVYDRFGVVAEVLDDAIEIPNGYRAEGSLGGKPTGVWVGSRDNWDGISRILKMMRRCGLDGMFEIITISDHEEAKVLWSLDNVLKYCRFADFSLLPVDDTLRARAKSSNRLSMFLAMGLPVIAERIPAYVDLAAKTGGVVFVTSEDEWCHAVENMLNQSYRTALAGNAAGTVRQYLDMAVVGERWLEFLSRLHAR